MRDESGKREKRARLDPTDSGFGELDPTRGKPAGKWRRDDDRYSGGATKISALALTAIDVS